MFCNNPNSNIMLLWHDTKREHPGRDLDFPTHTIIPCDRQLHVLTNCKSLCADKEVEHGKL